MDKVLLVDPALAGLAERFRGRLPVDVEVAAVSSFDDAEFARLGADATVLVNARRPIGAPQLSAARSVRLIQAIGVRIGAAEHAVMLMLALVKRLPASERSTRAGRFSPADVIPLGIDDLADATVGIVGMGRIGRTVAE